METKEEWRKFNGGEWYYEINVSDFIKNNYRQYTGGEEFLAGPTAKTKRILKVYEDVCKEEIKNITNIELLPFHTMAFEKYKELGIKNPYENIPAMDNILCKRLEDKIKEE